MKIADKGVFMKKSSSLTINNKFLVGALLLSAQLLVAHAFAGNKISNIDRDLTIGKIEATESLKSPENRQDPIRQQTIADVRARIQELSNAQQIIGLQMENSQGLLPAAGQMISALEELISSKNKILDYDEIFMTMNESLTLLNLMEDKIAELK